jgi:hypothetical protein
MHFTQHKCATAQYIIFKNTLKHVRTPNTFKESSFSTHSWQHSNKLNLCAIWSLLLHQSPSKLNKLTKQYTIFYLCFVSINITY